MQTHTLPSPICTQLKPTDTDALVSYLLLLSDVTKKRFAPHLFTAKAVEEILSSHQYAAFAVKDETAKRILAYAVVHFGVPQDEVPRFAGYGLEIHQQTDCMYAPSVADEWQGKGMGSLLLQFICDALIEEGKKRIFLWGGVQTGNTKALHFYSNRGFQVLGTFEYKGSNTDMLLVLTIGQRTL